MIKKTLKRASALVAAAAFLSTATMAWATPITGGITTVTLDDDIAAAVVGAGVTPSAVGSGTLTGLSFEFPITGGDLSDTVIPGSTIEHDGSGIQFAAGDGSISLTIGDFIIDTTSLIISGFATSTNPATGMPLDNVDGLSLFSLSLNPGAGLPFLVSLTETSAGALNATFGTDLFADGLTIGTAGTAPTVAVSEPGMFGLLGAAAFAFALRRRRAQ